MRSLYFEGRGKSASAEAVPGDEIVGGWRREDLLRMNAHFVDAMQRAIARGLERRPDGEAPKRAA